MNKKQAFNPYLPSYEYVPDGEPRIFGNRVYIYGSHDAFNGNEFCVNDYVCYSADINDLTEWKYEGVIYKAIQDPRCEKRRMNMNAPDCIQGPDGRYYLYYQLSLLTITSVAVSDKPEGPFEFYGYVSHENGKPWGEKKGDSFVFDPSIFVDDDRKIYLYAGFAPVGFMRFLLHLRKNNLDNAICIELDKDMKTVISGEKVIAPGKIKAKGTSFEKHPFYEASSMRKYNGKYYFVYSSLLSHELCYAISDYPDKKFEFKGTLVSIGDIGFKGNSKPLNNLGNTHGGMLEINDKYYIFYHRQTNKQKCARQGCAEEIHLNNDGTFDQAEITSCGLNEGPLIDEGKYNAYIACNLFSKYGVLKYEKNFEEDKEKIHPYFTQNGGDREKDGDQYIANIKDGTCVGFKYFDFKNDRDVIVEIRGDARGKLEIKDNLEGDAIGYINLEPSKDWKLYKSNSKIKISGKKPLYFVYKGDGYFDFNSFELK